MLFLAKQSCRSGISMLFIVWPITLVMPINACCQLGSHFDSYRWRSGFLIYHNQCVFPSYFLPLSLFFLCSPWLESFIGFICVLVWFAFLYLIFWLFGLSVALEHLGWHSFSYLCSQQVKFLVKFLLAFRLLVLLLLWFPFDKF